MRRIMFLVSILVACACASALAREQTITLIGEGSTLKGTVPVGCKAVNKAEVTCASKGLFSAEIVFEHKDRGAWHPCDVIVSLRGKGSVKALRGSGLCYVRELSPGRFGVGYDPHR